jgi:hypothetical protein
VASQIAKAVHDDTLAAEIAVAIRVALQRLEDAPNFLHPEADWKTTP